MRSIVCYESQHGSAKSIAQTVADGLDCLCVNVDTPFQAEDTASYDNLVLVFGFRGPYTAQLTKLFLNRMGSKLKYKNVVVVGVGLFSQKEFPSVAEGLRALAQPATFHTFFAKGELRVDSLTMEENAILGQFSRLTGMVITDMGKYSQPDADALAAEVRDTLQSCPVLEDPLAGVKQWICTICGYVHTGDEPPEVCPVCDQPAEYFKEMV